MKELTRVMGSEGLTANIGYEGSVDVVNDFDAKYPWSNMVKVENDYGDSFIRIYKYYVYYETDDNGYVTGRQISLYKVSDDWQCKAFLDENGKELPYIDIGCYLADITSDGYMHSRSGYKPTTGKSIADARIAAKTCNNYDDGYNYQLFDFRCNMIEQDLFTIEFATSNSLSIMTGLNYSQYSSSFPVNGETDSIEYVTGAASAVQSLNGSVPMKYRGIENVLGGGQLVIDGIITDGTTIKVCGPGLDTADDSNYIVSSLSKVTSSGKVANLGYDAENGLVFPQRVMSDGDYCDAYGGNSDKNQTVVRGRGNTEAYGLFCYSFMGATANNRFRVYRLVRKPKL